MYEKGQQNIPNFGTTSKIIAFRDKTPETFLFHNIQSL